MKAIQRVAADVGGTFTDIVTISDDGALVTYKLPSTPPNFADAVVAGTTTLMESQGVSPTELKELLHGTTVATNLILEQKGAKTALITTKGFRDVLELRRIRVPKLYQPLYVKPPPLVPRHLRFEVNERVGADGKVLVPLAFPDVERAIEEIIRKGVEAVAVCLLHSYANPSHERAIGEVLRQRLLNCFVSLSVDVLPQKREYERTSTTVINSYVGPPVSQYVGAMVDQMRKAGIGGRLKMMQSDGGILDAESVMRVPAQIVECGPAAGVIGAGYIGKMSGYSDLITLDMGGTTAKASIIERGSLAYADEYEVAGGASSRSFLAGGGGYALKLPVVDVLEVGAGGGSIAWLDKAGLLKIGPHSAGAVPGPACYGQGNSEPTVTDANVALGYLNQSALAGGSVLIDAELARQAVRRVASALSCTVLEAAYGIHTVANANMMRVVKAVTTYRGRDPRDFVLFTYGGNGGIHAVDLARVLQIRRVLVPLAAGVFSAVGLLFSKQSTTRTQPFHHLAASLPSAEAAGKYALMASEIQRVLAADHAQIEFRHLADVRFLGQAFEITVPFSNGPYDQLAIQQLTESFTAEHIARYGHAFAGKFPVEIVNVRLTGTISEKQLPAIQTDLGRSTSTARRSAFFGPTYGVLDTPVFGREKLSPRPELGPMIIEEYEGTIVVPPDCNTWRDSLGNVVIELRRAG